MAKAIKTVKTKQQLQVLLNQVTGVGRELLAQWIDLDPIYVGEIHKAEYVPSIKKHLLHAVDHVTVDGAWCEFGVREGRSLKWLIDYKPNQPMHGFDSWQGLPEDWDHGTGIVESMACSPPKVPGHVQLHEGWFHATTPKFEANTVGFLHMDADIYSSTKEVLTNADKVHTTTRGGNIGDLLKTSSLFSSFAGSFVSSSSLASAASGMYGGPLAGAAGKFAKRFF